MFARGQVLVSSVLLSWIGLSLIPVLAYAQEESGAEESPVVAEPATDGASGAEDAATEEENPAPAAVICCDDGGGGTGGTGLDFELSVLEPQVPHRYPGSTALGDGYNPVTGEVTFAVTDISIPGNSPIPVELSRWIPSQDLDTGGPTGWQWNLPLIKGNYLDVKPGHNDTGWDWGYNNWHNGENCSGDADSVMDPNDNLISGNMYWEGKLLHIPGVTSEKFLIDTGYHQVTKSNFKITDCIVNANGQEGIVVSGPNGLTYTFNYIKSYFNGKTTLKDPIIMTRILMVTRIEDRFGNYVTYTYTGGELTKIAASDGRQITIAYQTIGTGSSAYKRPTTATANGRIWTYVYASTGAKHLTRVTLPDGSQWQYNEGVYVYEFDANDPVGAYNNNLGTATQPLPPACGADPNVGNQYANVTTPEGATIAYTFHETLHNRSNVEPGIYNPDSGSSYVRNLHCTVSMSLTKRIVSGPGVGTFQWTYDYSENQGTYTAASNLNAALDGPFAVPAPVTGYPSGITSQNAVDYRTVTVSGPGRRTLFWVYRKFGTATEGMVLATDYVDPGANTLLERVQDTYAQGARVGSHWYHCPCGGEYPPSNTVNAVQLSYRINPTKQVVTLHAGGASDVYTTEFSNFDTYGFGQHTREYNDFNGKTRYTRQTYVHDTTNWLLGLPAETLVSDSNIIFGITAIYSTGFNDASVQKTSYHSATGSYKSLPNYRYAYGRWFRRNESYHTSGVQAGLPMLVRLNATNRWAEYSNYKRGIAQTVRTPESLSTASQYAYRVVDDNGWITQQTDFLGQCVNYGYDDVGRLTLIDPCDTRWLSTTVAWAPTISSEGLTHVVAGMPKQTVTTGNYQKITYFDALLRPKLVKEWDKIASTTARYTRTSFDAYDSITFQSLPHVDSSTPYGVVNQYDGIGRLEIANDNTVNGAVEFTYLIDNQVQTNDNNGNITTTVFLAYGAPEQSLPTSIAQPHSVTTMVQYNVHGNLTSASQGGITEYRVYDAYQQLCKTVRPDVGNTAYYFDAVGQLRWKASGSSVDGTTAGCTTVVAASAKIDYTYDNLGNVHTVAFGDSSPDKTYGYDKNSRLKSLAAGAVTTTYDYNSKNLLEWEKLSIDGQTFLLNYGYNSTGNLTTTIYPSGASIPYLPNALDQPTQAGGYASGATWHPNGMVKSHGYGNGFVHTSTLNTTGLPSTFYDLLGGTYALNHGFGYDANHNLTFWDDKVSNSYDVVVTYDGLDRLNTITDSYLGAGDVNYDGMGNITYYKLGSETITYVYNGAKRLDYTTGSKAYAFVYDERGNVANNGQHAFTYNTASQMIAADGHSYVYDGNNKRVKQTDSHGTSYSFYGSNGKLMYRNEGGVQVDYYYLGAKLVAKKSGSTITYLHSDYLGSTAAESNTNGTVTARRHYQPFGESIETPTDDVGYTGHKFDTDLDLSYMEARYYDPVLGRFMANDPLGFSPGGPMTFNRYSYANNNPYTFIDPDGRQACEGEDNCFEASNYSPNEAGNQTVTQSANIDDAAVRNLPNYESSGKKENAVRFDESTSGPVATKPVPTTTVVNGNIIESTISGIAGAEAIGHSHPVDTSDPSPGPRDDLAVNAGLPNNIVHDGNIVVIEKVNGQFRVRVLKDSDLTNRDRREIQKDVNRFQKRDQ